ncbi:DUF4440 domain-containing protein [Muriicola jejuensis]|uniref:DUF4440 domain-containing protein n=2 Tax=Muriicola jejuensis TaxID=504488 RepID=A0A6P0UAV4_9FLAO|nr:DUF4440 domain-containing protein [Muriicola jejuensis]
MKLLIKCFFSLLLLGCQNDISKKNNAKSSEYAELSSNKNETDNILHTIKSMDSLFFDIAYNQCDTLLGRNLISKDFEFYHDKGGPLLNTSDELASEIMIEDLSWIGKQTFRKLVIEEMEVFPLYENENLYGAIETGHHQFFKVVDAKPTELTTNAKFIHLWILENNNWKLKRVFSYDHQSVIKN